MQLWAVLWACVQAGFSCGSSPDISTIQSAYEREQSSGSSLHDRDLRVLEARCHDDVADRGGGSFLCEVKFISTSDPTERLYFDIVAVKRWGNGWKLASGLCKR
jgi:hypothetical protein